MKHTVSQDLFRYWNTLRAGRTAPERGDVDPAAIRHILAYTFILEVTGVGRSRDVTIRLSGTRLNALFQCELKGRAFDEIWAARDMMSARQLVDGVLDDRTAVVAGAKAAPPENSAVDLELLVLPLRHHGRTHTRLLGSLAAIGTPSWIGLRPVTGLELTSFRTLPSPTLEPGRNAFDSAATPDPQTAADPFGAVRKVSGFRVYQGGRSAAGSAAL